MAQNTHSLSLASASSQAVSITDNAALKPTGNFTVEFWMKSSTTDTTFTPFQSYAQNTNVAGIVFESFSGNKMAFYTGKNTGTTADTDYKRIATSTAVYDGLWHHIAVTWDGSNLKMYVNGILDSTVAWANAPAYQATNYVRIGCRNNTGTNTGYWNGGLDDVRLWAEARTATQIHDNMFKDVTGETNLTAYWKLNNDYVDSDGGYNGSAIGSPTFSTSDLPFPTYRSLNPVALGSTVLGSDANIKGYWPLDSNSNDSINSINGTDTNISYAAAKFSNGASMNGTTSKITIPDNANIRFTTAFSISAWIKATSVSRNNTIFAKDSSTTTTGYRLNMHTTNKLRFTIPAVVDIDASNMPALLADEFYHVVITHSGTSYKFYVNGILVDNVTSASNSTGGTDTGGIGHSPPLSYFFAGLIDDVAVFNDELTATEIFDLYTGIASSPSASVSPSVSVSASPSVTPSVSVSLSPSITPSVSVSLSPSVSASVSVSKSPSSSQSPSSSVSLSISPTPSISVSLSPSPSPSVSVSLSPSVSVSASPSLSPSLSGSPSASVSLSISPTPSVSESLSPSITPSASISLSPSVSASITPSISVSLSPSLSPSLSGSPSVSVSLSISSTPSVSVSASPSVSLSLSISPTPSVSVSPSPSVSVSLSPSVSPSVSESVSESASPSVSPSATGSFSISPSPSLSVSLTPSVSVSLSISPSPSVSISLSPSASVSPSPSPAIYVDKYEDQGTLYVDKYEDKNTTYIDKYRTW